MVTACHFLSEVMKSSLHWEGSADGMASSTFY